MTDEKLEQKNNDLETSPKTAGELDTAGRSLTDALKISFNILRIIMILLVVLFLTSGIFRVQENQRGMVLRFGKIRGTGEGRILDPGLHWAWPEPISEIVTIPVTKIQVLDINSFWYFESPEVKLGTRQYRPPDKLDPTRDGYCLTRNDNIPGVVTPDGTDYNIVHAKWQLKYQIEYPDQFFKNIYYRAPGPGQDFLDVVSEDIAPLLESLSSDAIVTTMVKYSIDDAIRSNISIAQAVKNILQSKLDRIDSGITVKEVSGRITWPGHLNADFENSINARQLADQAKSNAWAQAEKILSEAGGRSAEQVMDKLQNDSLTKDEKAILFSQLAGKAEEIISQARAYRTKVVKSAEADAGYLKKLLPEYKKQPKLVLQKIYTAAIAQVYDNTKETIFIQPSISGKQELRVTISKEPKKLETKKEENQTN